jgi:alkylated DNA repair dioxygenase AlkB
MCTQNLLPRDGEVYYFPDALGPDFARQAMVALIGEVDWSQRPIKIFGRQVLQPRLTAWCADPGVGIRYSGITFLPQPWSKTLCAIKEVVEALTEHAFNGVLLNHYRDGEDSMGWHRDNESYLGPEPVIASVSLGAERDFKMRHCQAEAPTISIKLQCGSALIMRGKTQTHWQHSLPRRKREKSPRINLTFRAIIT